MTNPFLHFVDDFEKEAEAFLVKYGCADAVATPRRIPIYDIATKLMSLDVVQTECLSPDDSVQGAIAFSRGIIDVYDWTTKEYMGYAVESPTVFVDSGILSAGRISNTLAHECFHWWRHRNYFNYKRTHENSVEFGIRCDKVPQKEASNARMTDVERMEWQARTIAPKILMPQAATRIKIEELRNNLPRGISIDQPAAIETVITELADFFDVSRQSAAIRMAELGYSNASQFTSGSGFSSGAKQLRIRQSSTAARRRQRISPPEVFRLYCENESLRATMDTGAFCFAEGYLVLRHDKYVEVSGDGGYALTACAKSHLSECTLDFSTKLIGDAYLVHDSSAHMMYRSDTSFTERVAFDANTQNAELFNKAKEFERKYRRSKTSHKTANEQLWEYIQGEHWNSVTFTQHTGLDAMHYTRVQKPDHKFTLRPLVAIGVGLKLDLCEMEEVLSLAGLSFNPTDHEAQAYKFLFTGMHGKTIEECNDFLAEVKATPLGTQQRS